MTAGGSGSDSPPLLCLPVDQGGSAAIVEELAGWQSWTSGFCWLSHSVLRWTADRRRETAGTLKSALACFAATGQSPRQLKADAADQNPSQADSWGQGPATVSWVLTIIVPDAG